MPIPRSCAVPRIVAKGVSILRPPVLAILPATKLKAPWTRLNRAEFGAPVRSQTKFVQHQARGGGKIERGAVDESYADGAIGSGLNRIALIDQGADAGSNKHPVGAHDGDGTDRRPDFADSFERRGRRHLDGTDDEAFARHIARVTKHAGFPLPLGLRAES